MLSLLIGKKNKIILFLKVIVIQINVKIVRGCDWWTWLCLRWYDDGGDDA